MYLLEYVTEQTVLLRHPNMEDTVRRFFADAGTNGVRAFYSDDSGLGGYIFYVMNAKDSPGEGDSGRFYKLVTTYDATWTLQEGRETPTLLRPRQIELDGIRKQFNNNEWFTGTFRGLMDRVASVNIDDKSEPE